MPALRTLGLVVMAALVVSIGSIGYIAFEALLRDRAAQDALLSVGNACEGAVTVGGNKVVEVGIPGGYTMSFVENRVEIDGHRFSHDGFPLRFVENSPELGPGTHRLSIEVSENWLVVTRIS